MQLLTNETFAAAVNNGIVVVDFFATWCGPCKMIAPYLDQMADHYAGKVSFYKVDVDEQPYLSASQGIRAMPTLKVFYNGKVEQTVVGADLQAVINAINAIMSKEQVITESKSEDAGLKSDKSLETQEEAKKVTIPTKKDQ